MEFICGLLLGLLIKSSNKPRCGYQPTGRIGSSPLPSSPKPPKPGSSMK